MQGIMAAIQIEAHFSSDEQRRFSELVAKRQDEAISPDELRELVALSDQSEEHDAKRLATLIELAQLREMTLPVLMIFLGITARPIL
jgi:hypothetical protein